MRLVVCGGKHLADAHLIERELARLHARRPITVLLHGGHPVLGTVLEAWAREQRIDVVRYPANWQHLGSRAEDVRNAFMLRDGRPDLALVLPGGRDTRAFVAAARHRGVAVMTAGTDASAAGLERACADGDEPEPRRWGRLPVATISFG